MKNRPTDIKKECFSRTYTHTLQRRMCASLRCKAAHEKRPTCIKRDLYTYIYEKRVFLLLTHVHTHTRQRRMCTSLRCKAVVGCSCGWITQVQHCRTLQRLPTHTATHCNTLQHTATHCSTLQHTFEYAATHCNTRQRLVAVVGG